jgi:uncharacterized RDD family membrane protein YckC
MSCPNHPGVEEGVFPCTRCLQPFCADCLVTIHGQPFCAVCKREKLLDVQSGTDGVAMQLAGLGKRFAAFVVDSLLITIPFWAGAMFVFALLMTKKNEDAAMLALFGGILLTWPAWVLYEALMLSRNGQTLGKRAMNIRVVRPDGSPISRGQAWGRTLLRAVLVHALMLLNYIPAFATKEKTCVHDLVAGTRVVRAH